MSMTSLTEDPLDPSAHAARPAAAEEGEEDEEDEEDDAAAGTASRPSTRAPPAATVSGPAVGRAREGTAVLRRARPASPFISLVAPMGGYLQRHRIRRSPSAGAQPGAAWGMGAKES